MVVKLSENCTVTAPKCHCADNHYKTSWKDDLDASDNLFFKLPIFCVVMALREDFTVRAPKCSSAENHHKTSWKQLFRGLWLHSANWPSLGSKEFSEIFTLRARNVTMRISTIRPAEKNDFQASYTILQINHLSSHNLVKWEFHRNSSKYLLWWSAP